jgi:hypothetical protein
VRRWREVVEAETAITEEAILRTEMIGSHRPMKNVMENGKNGKYGAGHLVVTVRVREGFQYPNANLFTTATTL